MIIDLAKVTKFKQNYEAYPTTNVLNLNYSQYNAHKIDTKVDMI